MKITSRHSSYRIARHVLFWTVYVLFWTLLYGSQSGYAVSFMATLIYMVFHGGAVYTNFWYLFPRYFVSRRYVLYSLLLVADIFVWSIGLSFTLYALFGNQMGSNPEQSQWLLSGVGIIVMGIGTATIVAVALALLLLVRRVEHDRQTRELESKNLSSELQLLRSQIHPHFLFNVLNSLYALTLQKSDLAPGMVLKLSDILRYILYECGEPEVPLEKELNYLQNYIDLEKMRHGTRADIDMRVTGTTEHKTIEPMLFLPFVENCFKHGANGNIAGAFVHIHFDIDESRLLFRAENSRNPAVPSNDATGGIGLANVRRRLELLYPDRHTLTIEESGNSYTVLLALERA
jgi:two-component system LytT family sensor kinase